MNSRRVLVVGAGRVGRALGANLLAHGYVVDFAVRDVNAADIPPGGAAVPVEGAAEGHGVVILAVPFPAVAEAVRAVRPGPRTVLIDATNPFGRPLPDGDANGAETVSRAAGPDVTVVKAFNVLGAEHMASPPLADGSRPLLPVAGDDPAAVRRVVELVTELGFDGVGVGDLSASAILEEAARYWGLLAFAGGRGRDVVLVAHDRGDA